MQQSSIIQFSQTQKNKKPGNRRNKSWPVSSSSKKRAVPQENTVNHAENAPPAVREIKE